MRFEDWDEDELRERMIADHRKAELAMMRAGFVPPWIDPDTLLDNRQRAVLTILADHMGVDDCLESMRCLLGYKSRNNASAAVNDCVKHGLVERDNGRLNFTEWGRIVFDIDEAGY